MALTWVVLIFYLVFYILFSRNKQTILRSLRFTGVLLIFWLVLNSYWLIPNFYALQTDLGSTFAVYEATGTVDKLSSWLSGSVPSITDAMRLTGFWGFSAGIAGDPFYTWASVYSSRFFLFTSFLIPIVAFLPILTRSWDKYVVFFTFLALVIIFQLKGPNPPLGDITRWVYSNVPLLRDIGVSPFLNLSPALVLSYSFLIGCGIDSLYNLIGRGGKNGTVSS